MTRISRPFAIAVGAAAAMALAAPAMASAHLKPTSLNLRAGKTTVRAHHSDTFTATLRSAGKPLAGQTVVVEERTAASSTANGKKKAWTAQDTVSVTDNGDGTYTFTVTPPIASSRNTQKDQFRAVFQKTDTYAGSHSQAITVTVKRAAASSTTTTS